MKHLVLATLMTVVISGCASLPDATYVTSSGCGIAQWNKQWIEANVASMAWDGPCKDGLSHGRGTHVVMLKNGRQRRYVGEMQQGFITGNGDYTLETGWRYDGSFLWATFTAGKIYGADGKLLFDGLMAHNEKYNGQNVVYNDQRFHKGKLYFPDGSYIDDGRYTGSAGPRVGIGSINPQTGAGLVYGKYVKGGQVVYRLVDGKLYKDDISYLQAQGKFYEALNAAMNREIAAQAAAQRAKDAAETRAALQQLTGAALAAAAAKQAKAANAGSTAGTTSTTSATQAAIAALTQSTSGTSGNSAGVGSQSSLGVGQAGKAGRPPDARCAFAKLYFGYYTPNSTYIDNAIFQLRVVPFRRDSKDRIQKHYEDSAKRVASYGPAQTAQQRAIYELAARAIREWKETLACVEENGEFMLSEGESLPQLFAFPKEWIGRDDLPQSLATYGDSPKLNYGWKACETNRLGITKGALAQVVLHRSYEASGLHSRFMLASQLEYLRGVYAEITGESALSSSLRMLNPDPRTTPSGKSSLAELKNVIKGLECEAALGFPLSAEETFVKSSGWNKSRYPGTQIPRCTKAQPCSNYY